MLSFLAYAVSCSQPSNDPPVPENNGDTPNVDCQLVEDGFGPEGTVEVGYETVVSGLEVPWGMDFLPNGDLLVTERAGRIRLVRDISGEAQLLAEPVATVEIASSAEGGLLGLTLHPDFEQNRFFYIYLTVEQNGETTNQVERWQLSEDGSTAEQESIIFEGIRASRFHNGGRIRFGPDGMLYVGTGDAGEPELSQDPQSPNGKLLRLTPEGDIPEDNPISGSPAFLTGIRNTQGWDWPDPNDATTLWLTDHGPSGELGRRGHDEINMVQAGDNLGWPDIYGCEQQEGFISPALSWEQAVPPGGAAIYTGTQISEWTDDLLVATLGSRHLHRAVAEDGSIAQHEVYFQDEIGRLREILMGPDGSLYITTSNCDGRGDCPSEGDQIIRITP